MSNPKPSISEVAYEAYREAMKIERDYRFLDHDERIVWNMVSQAVAQAVLPRGVYDEKSTVEASQSGHTELMDRIDAKIGGDS